MSRKVICFLGMLSILYGVLFYDNTYAAPSGTPPPIYTKKPLPNPRKQEPKTLTKVVENQEKKIVTAENLNIISTQTSNIEKKPITQVFDNKISVDNGLVSVHVVDYLVVDLLNTVFNKLNKKIVISSNVIESVSLQVDNITPEKLLEIINTSTGINWVDFEGIIIVSTDDKLTNAAFFPVNYADLKSMKDSLSVFGIDDKITINNYPRGLLVSGVPATLKNIENVIRQLDKRLPSIKVEFKVLEVNKSKERRLGISWQNINAGTVITRVFGATQVMNLPGEIQEISTGLVGTAQETQSWGKILARPYIITTNGTEAHLSTGDEIPIFSKDYNGNPTIEYKKVGIELYATPSLLEGDLLNIKAKTIVNIISGNETQQGLTAPKISSREAETIMQVQSGHTIVIGGLIKQEEIKSTVKVPLLGEIPLIGSLFKSTQKSKSESEILIFITPTIIYPDINNNSN